MQPVTVLASIDHVFGDESAIGLNVRIGGGHGNATGCTVVRGNSIDGKRVRRNDSDRIQIEIDRLRQTAVERSREIAQQGQNLNRWYGSGECQAVDEIRAS